MQLTDEERQFFMLCGKDETFSNSEFEKTIESLNHKLETSLHLKLGERKDKLEENEVLEFALSLFLAISSKENLDYTNFCSLFYELNWNSERVNILWKLLEEKRRKTRWDLALSTTYPPQVVDIKWKLDNSLKSYGSQRWNNLCYIITLTLEECRGGKLKFLTFSCTLAQLTNLVTCLRRATRYIKTYSTKSIM